MRQERTVMCRSTLKGRRSRIDALVTRSTCTSLIFWYNDFLHLFKAAAVALCQLLAVD